jgi:hypothetical protein
MGHFISCIENSAQDWVKSVDKHNDMRERLIQADLPGTLSSTGMGASQDCKLGGQEITKNCEHL